MKNKKITLSILREARVDENRTPFSPTQISNLLDKFPNLKIRLIYFFHTQAKFVNILAR